MLEYIQDNALRQPGRGLHLYDRFDTETEFIAYAEFPGRVAAHARHLREHGIGSGTRVLFPFETSSAAVLSFLALLEIGALPLSVKPQLLNISKSAYQEFLGRVADQYGAEYMLSSRGDDEVRLSVPTISTSPQEPTAPCDGLRVPGDDEPAFVQFSSGSTSFPKGIPVSHGMLRKNLEMILRTDRRVAEERVSSWLPLYHDMGLVGGLLSCFACGCDLLLSTPETFLFDAPGWWAQLAREQVSGSVVPNFAIDYSLRMMAGAEPEEIAQLDLRNVRSMYLGSEPINIPNLNAFHDLMAPAGLRRDLFMPCYGMAEAVLLVASAAVHNDIRVKDSPSGVPVVSVGRPMAEFALRLRDEEGKPCADNELGEIEISGGSLAPAYFESEIRLLNEDGYYATGDVGFVDGGELFITGRIGDRIKVNGQSYFAADFEQTLERLDFVRENRTAVLQIDDAIVVLAEVDRSAQADIEGSRKTIVDHLVRTMGVKVAAHDVHFVPPRQLVRTSSGKLQRRAIAQAYREGRLAGPTFPPRAAAE